jgi:NADH-quinone oxidoreductase subunit K
VTVTLPYYLALSGVLFAIGVAGVLLKRNVLVVLMAVELMLNAVNLSFVALARDLGQTDGQVIVFFVMTVAAAEAVVGLAIILSVYRNKRTLDPEEARMLSG